MEIKKRRVKVIENYFHSVFLIFIYQVIDNISVDGVQKYQIASLIILGGRKISMNEIDSKDLDFRP